MNDYVSDDELFRGVMKTYLLKPEGTTKDHVVYLDTIPRNGAVPTTSFGLTRDLHGKALTPGDTIDGGTLLHMYDQSISDAMATAKAFPRYKEFDRAGRAHISLISYNLNPAVKAPETVERVKAYRGVGAGLTSLIQASNGFMDITNGGTAGLVIRRNDERDIANIIGKLPGKVTRQKYNELIDQIARSYSPGTAKLYKSGVYLNGREILLNQPVDALDKETGKTALQKAKEYLQGAMLNVHRQDAKGGKASRAALGGGETGGGETGGESVQSANEVPEGTEQTVQNNGGPRIIINPSTFRNEKDALCVAWNESFRILMEVNGFDPVSEPTERQRKFFSDTAYNDDELMLRRTILARICTFDTSVKDPTDEQLQEAMEFLDTVMEIGAPQNEWEQRAVKRIRDTIAQSVGQPRAEEPSDEEPPEDTGTITGAVGGGKSEDDLEDLFDEPSDFDDGSLDSLFDTRSNTEKETEQVINEIGKEGSAVVEGVEQLDPEGTKKALEYGRQMSEAVNNGFDASTQLPNSDPPQITSTSSGDAQQPAAPQLALPMKNGHYVDDQGRVITKRAAEALAAKRDAAGSQPTSTGVPATMTGIGGRKLTAGEAAWQERREASRRRSNRNGRDLTVFI